ncbi:hypothetical protein JYU14_04360 [Simkania negevensis]|uniref:Uncharacterized protein n=1 Tax=Simkania negevensis TaxID=83561 RepID=A0ABS3AWF3_9BACT|nr:hypothetical protein [Simkania negevensis]
MKFRHSTLITLLGLLWCAVGGMLLIIGTRLFTAIVSYQVNPKQLLFMQGLSKRAGGIDQAAIVLIGIALVVGYMKGKYVLRKSCVRVVNRLFKLPNPAYLHQALSKWFYLLIGTMICLGISLRVFGAPVDLRAVIDVAIGSALINGALTYFRFAVQAKAKTKKV